MKMTECHMIDDQMSTLVKKQYIFAYFKKKYKEKVYFKRIYLMFLDT